MSDILINDALRTLWCEPVQDFQHVYAPTRLTKVGGANKFITVAWDVVSLPNINDLGNNNFFHVYQIGKIPLDNFNITLTPNQWERLDLIALRTKTVFDLLLTTGVKIPNKYGYLFLQDNGNIILGVEIINIDLGVEVYNDPGIGLTTRPVSLNNYTLYLRTYTNARYDSIDFKGDPSHTNTPIKYKSELVKTQGDYTNFINSANAIINNNTYGQMLFFNGGFVVSKPNIWSTNYINRNLSYYWDESVLNTESFKLNETSTFISNVDPGKEKYILIRNTNYNMIDFQDDVDVYLVAYTTQTNYKGVLVPRLSQGIFRQLTHTAYSLDKVTVQQLISKHSFLTGDVRIMLVVREGGMKRGLAHQHVRIEELYSLPHSEVITAITTLTDIPEWYAMNLESSAYTAVMSSNIQSIGNAIVEDAYGYNTALRVGAEPLVPVNIYSGEQFITVPPVARIPDIVSGLPSRVIFLMNQGKLESWFYDQTDRHEIHVGNVSTPHDSAEIFNYIASTSTDGVIYNSDVTNLQLTQYGFRCYVCSLVGGIPDELWEDVTDLPYYDFDSVTGELIWNNALLTIGNLYPCVKINNTMHVFEQTGFPNYPGFMQIRLTSVNDWLGSVQSKDQTLYPGTLDVFMDGIPLIENIDYYVELPFITIVRPPVTTPDLTNVFIRSYGVCDPATMRNYPPREIGFVKEGILSINDRYDIRNDRSIRVIVNGIIKNRYAVKFAETDGGQLCVDGRPYAIFDYILPVENFTKQKLIPYRNRSLDMDNRVMDYLTLRLPQDTVRHPVVSIERWRVFSCFASAIIHAFINDNFLSAGELDTAYTKTITDGWLSSFLPLLNFDPCVRGVDVNYLNVLPHQYTSTLELTNLQYKFIEFVNINYLNGVIDQTPNITIG